MTALSDVTADGNANAAKAFYTTYETAKLLGVSLRTVQLWAESGAIPCWKTQGGHRRIPREAVDNMRGAGSGSTRETELALRVLVVEDDLELLRLYRLRLARWPMQPEVATASDSFEALVRIGNACPDLLITDLRMPNLDGFKMISSLRRMPELDQLEIVVVSGLDAAEIVDRGGLPKDVYVLPKPVPFDSLEQIAVQVATRLGRRQRPANGMLPAGPASLPGFHGRLT